MKRMFRGNEFAEEMRDVIEEVRAPGSIPVSGLYY